ncbi:unnamed protein product [Sphenostylis stenocarpa]|uniref:Uncharacterized protein n=1 Tax=Sphenostylis stenocarpa TaxID=92480 RepID=A0AA86V6H7_9FABA|nr:unnamed protein product [Sphenostylis stenocarpa]
MFQDWAIVMNFSSDSSNENGNFQSVNVEVEAKHRLILVQWLTSLLPLLKFPPNVTDGELRACLSNGTVLCQILNKLRPGIVNVISEPDNSLPSQSENVKSFLKALDAVGLPRFEISDLEKGSMKAVVDCLLTLREKSLQNALGDYFSVINSITVSPRVISPFHSHCSPAFGGEQKKTPVGSKLQRVLSSSLIPGPGLMLQNAPTQSLLSVVNDILEECVERKNGEMPHRVACLLRKVSQEIERRMSTQAEHLRTQNNLFKAREEKYQSRIRLLEALASETKDETELGFGLFFPSMQGEKIKAEKRVDEKEYVRLIKEQQDKNMEISALKIELETAKRTYEVLFSQLEEEAKGANAECTQKSQEYKHQLEELRNKVEKCEEEVKSADDEEIFRLVKELEDKNLEISALKQERETTKIAYEVQCSQLQKDAKAELEQKCEEYERQLEELRNKVNELEVSSDSKDQKWNMKMNQLQTVITFQFSTLQKMKLSLESTKQSLMKERTVYADEWDQLGVKLKPLLHAADNHHALLVENKKLFNEIQELKGNIRVYCRIKPFASGKMEKQSIVEYIGENDLVVTNPSKEGKEALRSFKFNRVFSSAATQAEVYSDIQDLTRSVLDGYNVCIFAYGQTGSGKTYTMTGPNGATSETIGVNYRALNDLFRISSSRESLTEYEIGVQMVEIYNEQVRDLLITDVPDASLFPVKLPSDVIKLMDIGLKNRAIGATAMNERSSRSHSVVSIHVSGKDLKTGSTMFGNLHLVDLAGSERVDRAEVTGDRLKEAQHINKSLSALGDVIFSLAQKSPHVPYRNSKLTQLLQTSLGGQAKTLMFVQINSDASSYSETMSTLKFAERVSGIELGAARSSKESKDVRELMEQVSSLKNTILAKDEEIERLQLLKGPAGSNVKRNLIPRTRSSIHLEHASQHPIDDHIHQNEFVHHSENYMGDIGKNVVATAETLGLTDSDFDRRSSDFSDSGVAPCTETDGLENSSLTEVPKSSEKRSGIRKTVQAMRKFTRTSGNSTSTTTPVKEPAKDPAKKPAKKSSGIRKSISIGNLKPPKL